MAAAVVLARLSPTLVPRLRAAALAGLQKAAVEAVALIKERTGRGVDSDGHPFKPYTRDYRNHKLATGRSVDPVDLRLSGDMLRCLGVKRVVPGARPAVVLGFLQPQHRRRWFGNASRRAMAFSNIDSRRTLGKRTLHKSESTTPMSKVVIGNMRYRHFFDVTSAAEKARLLQIVYREMASAFNAGRRR